MPKISEGTFALGGLAVFAVWLFIVLPILNHPTPQAPQIQTHQLPEHDASNQYRLQPETGNPGEEGTEFWPPFLGYRLKVTDTLIALFTAGLFIATWFLWRATKKLVAGAENTAERQLRAYVFITNEGNISVSPQNGTISVLIKLRNSGNSPGYEFSTWLGGGEYLAETLPFPTENKPLAERVTASIIGPSETVTIHSVNNPITPEVTEAIRDQHLGFFVWGGCDYTDAFGKRWSFVFRIRTIGLQDSIDANGNLIWALKPHAVGYTETELKNWK